MNASLIPYISSHQTTSEGGRKTHIGRYEDDKPLCGYDHPWLSGIPDTEIDEEWIIGGIRSYELCRKCAKAALKVILKQLEGAPKRS